MSRLTRKVQLLCPQTRQTTKISKITVVQLSQKNSSHERRVSRCWMELVTVIQVFISFQYQKKNTNKKGVSDNLAVYKCNRLLCFNIFKEEENESWEARPEIEDETEADDSDVPDHELGAVMEFDEDLLDEAQTEADARNIAKKHQMSFEALKRDVLGSVRK